MNVWHECLVIWYWNTRASFSLVVTKLARNVKKLSWFLSPIFDPPLLLPIFSFILFFAEKSKMKIPLLCYFLLVKRFRGFVCWNQYYGRNVFSPVPIPGFFRHCFIVYCDGLLRVTSTFLVSVRNIIGKTPRKNRAKTVKRSCLKVYENRPTKSPSGIFTLSRSFCLNWKKMVQFFHVIGYFSGWHKNVDCLPDEIWLVGSDPIRIRSHCDHHSLSISHYRYLKLKKRFFKNTRQYS